MLFMSPKIIVPPRAIDWRVDGWDRGKDVIDRLFLPGPKRRRPAAKTSVLI